MAASPQARDFLMIFPDAVFPAIARNPFIPGAKRSWVPVINDVVWKIPKEDEERGYFAYSFRLQDGRGVGYVRIPDYDFNQDAVEEFGRLVARFQDTTELLIIDQVGNPGGSMLQMYALLSLLTDRPLAVPQHQVTISDDAAAVAADIVANADEELPERVAYSHLLLSEKAAGRGNGTRLSHPLYLEGIEAIVPAKNPYTKKIVVLINGLTFSAGEFLAAIIQDTRRGMLFGMGTAGAGGCSKKFVLPTSRRLGIDHMMITWTIARRTNGETIEDDGVQPDVTYEPTVEDMESSDPLRRQLDELEISGFQGYRFALLKTLIAVLDDSAVSVESAARDRSWRPSQAELNDILEQHKALGDSKGKKGKRAQLSGADLTGVDLAGASLAGVSLAEAHLGGANLRSANFAWSNLRGVTMNGADLRGADLSGAYLSGAKLSGANLTGANLAGTNLSRADLSDTDLSGANVLDAYLPGANLSGTDLRTATGLSAEQLRSACAVSEKPTQLPAGFDLPPPCADQC